MLRVITPATNTRLTTAAAVRAQFAIPASVLDATLEGWIDRVSAQIVSYCGRPFATEVVREKIPTPAYAATIYLARSPVRSLSVTESGVVLTVNTHYHVDESACSVTRLSADLPIAWSGQFIQFDYTSGYVLPGDGGTRTLPYDVEHAAILLAGALYANESSASSGGGSVVKAEEVEGLGRTEFFVATASQGNAAPRLSHPSAELLLRPYVEAEFA